MMNHLSKGLFLLVALTHFQGCSLTCEEAAQKVGLFKEESRETIMKKLAEGFFANNDDGFPSKECPHNLPQSMVSCKDFSQEAWSTGAGVHCNKAATVQIDSSKDQSIRKQPINSNSNSLFADIVPFIKTKIAFKATAQVNDFCEATFQHDHVYTGPLEGDLVGKCNQTIPTKFSVQKADFSLSAIGSGEISYSNKGESGTYEVDTGSICSASNLTFLGCNVRTDGQSCSKDALPPRSPENGENSGGTETPSEEENENSEGQPGRFIGFDGTTVDCLLRSSVAECSACCESNAADEISYTNCNNACDPGSSGISISLE